MKKKKNELDVLKWEWNSIHKNKCSVFACNFPKHVQIQSIGKINLCKAHLDRYLQELMKDESNEDKLTRLLGGVL